MSVLIELNVPHVTPYIVGDLSKEEAKEYFEKHVLPYYDSEFLVFRLEDDNLSFGLNPVRFQGKPAPLWNKDDFIKVMKAIVEAEDRGYIKEMDLVNEIGVEKVRSLITYDLLHRRPTNNYANDIIDPPNEAILTAMNKPSIRAMECRLYDID
ncbi:unnamed protein product [Rhizophagus irregularis]|nr:unnamed protein product [Rhizophagus irregularis]